VLGGAKEEDACAGREEGQAANPKEEKKGKV